jgi:hypothetical protein
MLAVVAQTCLPTYNKKQTVGELHSRLAWAKIEMYLKDNQRKKELEVWLKQ